MTAEPLSSFKDQLTKAIVSIANRDDVSARTLKLDKFLDEEAQIVGLKYGKVNTKSVNNITLLRQTFPNNTSVTDTAKVTKEVTTTAKYSWTIDASLKIGVNATIEGKIPEIGKGNVGFSPELNFSCSLTQEKTYTQKWTIENTVPTPPHSEVTVEWIITDLTVEADFWVEIRAKASYEFEIDFVGRDAGIGAATGAAVGGGLTGIAAGAGGANFAVGMSIGLAALAGGPVTIGGLVVAGTIFGAAAGVAGLVAGGSVGAGTGAGIGAIAGAVKDRPVITARDAFMKMPGFREDSDGYVYCCVNGKFTGVQGVDSRIETTEKSL